MKKIMLAMLLVLCVGVMTACSGNGNNTESDAVEYVFNELELDKGQDCVSCTYLNGNDFYYVSFPYPDVDDEVAWEELKGKEYAGSIHLYKIDSGEDSILFDVKYASDIGRLYVTEQNQIKILYSAENDSFSRYTLITKTLDGADVSSISLADTVNAALEGGGTIDNSYFEQDGQIYLSCEGLESGQTYIVRCDMEGNVTGSVKMDGYIDGVFLDNENRMAVETNSNESLKYVYIDFEKGECGETVAIQDEEDKYMFASDIHGGPDISKIYNGYGDASCYVRDVTGLCSYNAAEQKVTYLLDWSKTGIIGSHVSDIIPVEDGKLFCNCYDMTQDENTYGIIEELENGKERKVIKCAMLKTENDRGHNLEKKIINYNKSNTDYRVELVTYDKSSNPIDAFAKDVISGNIPDVLDISGVDVKSYISQGFFEDLVPYMEKDAEFGKDFYVDGLYDAIAVDGKQYYAVKNFTLETIAAKASDTEKYKDGWTIHDVIDYYNAKPEGTLLHMYETKKEIFERFAAPFIDDYIDWDTGTVNFDSDEFRAAAEFCSSFPSSYEIWSDYNEVSKMIREGKILINEVSLQREMDDFCYNRALFDEDMRFIGFPSADKTKALIIPSSSSLAITASSNEKDAAWDFVKSVITEDEHKKYEFGVGIPAGKEQFEKMVRRLTITEAYTEEDGTIIKPLSGESSMNEFEYSFKPFREEEINLIRDMIKNAVVKTDNSAIMLIVESGLNDYFDGRKTLDELVSVLQDRIGKYVNENR
ncbi:MAG: extracellular solute-binding protein [Lachnospiraceae bacterium]|nr:extracellular solute-binding protein [Lachnospiraceae bacterium]